MKIYIQHCNTIASIQHHRSNLSSARYTTIGAGYHPRMLGESTSSWSREDSCQLDASWTITSRYRCAFNIIWTEGVISDKRYFCVYTVRSQKKTFIEKQLYIWSAAQPQLQDIQHSPRVLFLQRRRHHSCPADRCQGCSENNHCQRLKVDSKELGGCGHFVDKAKSCWPLLLLCPPLLLFVLLLLHHHLYTLSTASHVTGVLSANNQRLIILPQHLVLPCHASALLLCVLANMFNIWIATFHILQGGNGWFWWLLVVMGGYGVDTVGFGCLLVIVNNPKIIGPKMSKILKK